MSMGNYEKKLIRYEHRIGGKEQCGMGKVFKYIIMDQSGTVK